MKTHASSFYSMYDESSKVFLINHFKKLEAAASTYNAKLYLNVSNFEIELTISNTVFLLYPQFLEILDNKPYYTRKFTQDAVCFIGWRPYQPADLPNFADKLYMKKLFQESGFLTPGFSLDPNASLSNVIVKRNGNSFGSGLRGPFKSSTEYQINPKIGEFFEEFIGGEILKVYYWNETPVCMERQKMPIAVGNGVDSIEILATRKALERGRETDCSSIDDILTFQDKTRQTILNNDEAVLLDFRYESDFCDPFSITETHFPESNNESMITSFYHLGSVLFSHLKKENIKNLCYTVDAILTTDGESFMLEMNTNPTVHHLVYEEMIDSLWKQAHQSNSWRNSCK